MEIITGLITTTYLEDVRQKILLLAALVCLTVVVALYAVTQEAYEIAV